MAGRGTVRRRARRARRDGLMAIGGLAIAGATTPAGAAPLTPQELAEITLVDLPLVLESVDTAGGAERLWADGPEPANTLVARLTLRPVAAAVLQGQTPQPEGGPLWRAFTGGGVTRLKASELPLDAAPVRYCGKLGAADAALCYSDDTGDGTFDRIAPAVAERGRKPYHITLARGFVSLPRPLPYTVLPAAARPAITVALRNCAKDYDRPRFSAQSEQDRGEPMLAGGFGWHDKDSSFGICRRARQIDAPAGQVPPPGGFTAQLGPLAVTVGPRKAPALGVAGPADPDALYRLEAATLVDLGVGPTPSQAEIGALKKFPYPLLMAEPGGTITGGTIAPGALLARLPFQHAYRGRLVAPVEIRTLLGKRALPAGTVLYGYPARRSVSSTINGMPVSAMISEDSLRRIDVALTWCTPVPGQPPQKPNAQEIGRNGWSAACVPQSRAGTYTILTDRQPALAVEGLSYDVNTSSNPGPVPAERQDEARFDRPLRLEYAFERHEGETITLRENIYFGDALTSSKIEAVYAPEGKAFVSIAGTRIVLTRNPDGTITAEPAGAPVTGSNVQIEWDREAMMLAAIRRMGMKPLNEPDAPPPAPPAAPAAPAT